MAASGKPVIPVQVRELVEFALRRGGLGGERDFVGPNRALAGIRGHQRLQRARPAGYQKEVRLAHAVETEEFILRVQGRIDGLLATAAEALIEEIKTVQGRWDGVADPLHWAQAKCYGFIYARAQALERITLQLTYLNLETDQATEMRAQFSLGELTVFFAETTAIYIEWLREHRRWRALRDQSIQTLPFPFPRYRPGQRKLAVAAYRVLAPGGRLFLEAPTGIGKTISVLFPAVKAMGEGKLERIFYLTARTVGRAVAEKALADLRQAGLRLRALTLTAKEKICIQTVPGASSASSGAPVSGAMGGWADRNVHPPSRPARDYGGQVGAPPPSGVPVSGAALSPTCDAGACPYAGGYYDRCKPAMRAALAHEAVTRSVLEAVGREHQVCPYELSLDLSAWVDAVICDYNYVFDPQVYLRRHFGEEAGDYAFLVDEAHNLVDRAREMFSADLDGRELHEVRRAIKGTAPRCVRALGKLGSALRQWCEPASLPAEAAASDEPSPQLGLFESGAATSITPISPVPPITLQPGLSRRELPAELLPPLEAALKEAEAWLGQNQPAAGRESLLGLYFRLLAFQRTAGLYDERYVTLGEAGANACVRLFCLDPSGLLRQALARGKAAVFFSATLTPLEYYRELLGGEPGDPVLRLASPFPPENLAVLMQDRIRTEFKARAETLADVAEAIGAVTDKRRGNYLVYLPSYQYLTAVHDQFRARRPATRLLAQRPGLSEAEREAFLAAFAADHRETLVGFAVMGGIFGEGIDLVGERLIGAIIVGVGLPQLSRERDLIRGYFQEKLGAGFEYAYTFPGMNRVLQATGRVIRSETDRGVVLLIDTRFAEPRYRRLFPRWWRLARVRSPGQLGEAVRSFWEGAD